MKYAGNSDYTSLRRKVITLLPNETQEVVDIMIKEDSILEETEAFLCTLRTTPQSEAIAEIKMSPTTVFIEDNDSKQFIHNWAITSYNWLILLRHAVIHY